jgi:hypothetical protein
VRGRGVGPPLGTTTRSAFAVYCAAELATGELDRIAAERAEVSAATSDLEARISEWDGRDPADEMLDWWSEFSAGIREGVVGADSVREANEALRERFAAILAHSRRDGTVRLEFHLRTTPPVGSLADA